MAWRAMVWPARTESPMPHREVIAAVADLVLGQQTGQTVARHPLQAARLVREHAGCKRSRFAVEDPYAAGELPSFAAHGVDAFDNDDQKSSSTILPRKSLILSCLPPVFSQPRPVSSGARTRAIRLSCLTRATTDRQCQQPDPATGAAERGASRQPAKRTPWGGGSGCHAKATSRSGRSPQTRPGTRPSRLQGRESSCPRSQDNHSPSGVAPMSHRRCAQPGASEFAHMPRRPLWTRRRAHTVLGPCSQGCAAITRVRTPSRH